MEITPESQCVNRTASLSVFQETPLRLMSNQRVYNDEYNMDPHPEKMYLGSREYFAEDGEVWTLPVVRKVHRQILNDPTLCHDDISVLGQSEFNRVSTALILGSESIAIVEKRADSIQVPGGNGALFMAAQFLKRWFTITDPRSPAVYVSEPCWETHVFTFQGAGFSDIRRYLYWDHEKLCLAIPQWLEDMENAPEYSIIVLQVAAHWPTAMDPTPAEWRQIAEVMKRKRLFPFFFVTAQGLATGDLNKDAFPIRHFVTERFELLCAQSYSKNFGLCDERVGSLTIVSRDNPSLIRIRSQLMLTARCTWSTPPQLGARIVATILNNPAFFTEWQANLRSMAERLMLIREKLAEELRTLGTLRPLNHIRRQIGLYMFADFKDSEIMYLKKRRHIYLTSIGQINMSLMNSQNLSYVAQCISEAVQSGLETPETAQPTEL
ncbi:aspartate aminotransferase, cytoplasmic-like isoform X1 [Chiloscyllium plagiosum]|uniref:aspartate aminotransferase, cytoplasmic-like isoform X1 n=1 Tax=Chiloscyllium plagiosum TaxID=36176 RepID=UPI001CB7D4F7|nr:aspartate aminotransferase, cytoplasmic-like isoform X1 [Chiloscyllium plagiosum]